jgi:hypothetical protein
MAAPFVLLPPLEAELEVDATAFVVVAAVVLVLVAELEVLEVDEETWLRGIWASTVGAGEILKMSDGVLQHAKLPSPVVPLSQQLRTLKLSSSGNPKVGTHYFVVSVIAPSQNLIPAVDPVATGVFINHMICVSWPGTTYISYTGLSTLDPAMFCRCIPPLNSLEHFRWIAGRLRLRNI